VGAPGDGAFAAFALNVAVTAMSPLIVTLQAPFPEQAPLHPANVEPDAGVGVRVTCVFAG
jgi:hypothetical protein